MGKLKIVAGDILSSEFLENCDLVVNPTNPKMVCGSGVCGAIFHKAGVRELEEYTQRTYNLSYQSQDNCMKVGEIRVTPGFALERDIMFAQGPRLFDYDDEDEATRLLLRTYENIVNGSAMLGYKQVLVPCMGTGIYGFTHEKTGRVVFEKLRECVENVDIEVTLVVYDKDDMKYYTGQ